MVKRINISMSEELLEKVDKMASSMGITRSALIAYILAEKISLQDDMMNSFKNFINERIKEAQKDV